MLEQARKLLATLAAPTDPKSVGPQWKSLHTLLKKANCDQMRLARVVAERNVGAMQTMLEEIAVAPPPPPRSPYGYSTPTSAPAAVGGAAGEAAPTPPPRPGSMPPVSIRAEKPTPQQLKTALAAFKKRLKLTKLDQESRIGGRAPTSSGLKSGIIAILPPNLYPRVYWEELEKQGQIRNTGGGFYELVEKAKPIKTEPAAADAETSEPTPAE